MSDFFISNELEKHFSNNSDTAFEKIFHLEGEDFRLVKARRTFRFELDGKGFFAKVHRGIGWKEIFKDLFQFKKPILGAENEYNAIRHLEKINVPTMRCAAYGKRGCNPAKQESFLVTDELVNMASLEDFVKDEHFPALRKKILCSLADMLGRMHDSGLNHRDCYICHFLLDLNLLKEDKIVLHVIDLHRAQIRKNIPFRYRVKDVAGILFSSFDIAPTKMEMLRFIRIYSSRKLSVELKENRRFWQAVDKAARKLYKKEFGKEAASDNKF